MSVFSIKSDSLTCHLEHEQIILAFQKCSFCDGIIIDVVEEIPRGM